MDAEHPIVQYENETLTSHPRQGFSHRLAGARRKRLWGQRFPGGDGLELKLSLIQALLWERHAGEAGSSPHGFAFPLLPPPPFSDLPSWPCSGGGTTISLGDLPVKCRCMG